MNFPGFSAALTPFLPVSVKNKSGYIDSDETLKISANNSIACPELDY